MPYRYQLELIPSVAEMHSESSDIYGGPIEVLNSSLCAMQGQSRKDFQSAFKSGTNVVLEQQCASGRSYFPELLGAMTASLSSAAGAAALCKIIHTGISLKNGRRFVVTLPTGVHVEARDYPKGPSSPSYPMSQSSMTKLS